MEEEKTTNPTNEGNAPKTSGAEDMMRQSQSDTPQQKPAGGVGKIALAIIVVLILGVAAWAFMQTDKDDATTGAGIDMSAGTAAELPSFDSVPDVVATVDGVDITKEDYVEVYTQSWRTVAQQGANLSTPEAQAGIAAQVMDVLVNTELLAQASRSAGVSVSEEDVDTEISALAAQLGGEEGLDQALSEVGMDKATLRDDITRQLLIESYLQTTDEVANAGTVTEAEIQARYDEVAAQSQGGELPPLEEVKDAIKAQLAAEAEQTATQEVVDRLRAATDVKVFIELQQV